jgi:hypothetical protein
MEIKMSEGKEEKGMKLLADRWEVGRRRIREV